jgi:putative ABC transport system permease protein
MSRSQRMMRDVISSMAANRSRTALMVLALAVGAATLSAVVVLGQGTRERVLDAVAKHQLDMIMVRAGGDVQVFAPTADRGLDALREEDVRAVEAEVPGVVMASEVQNQRGIDVVFEDRSVTTRAFGVGPMWMEIRRWDIQEGEFISEADMAAMNRVAILGAGVASRLFPEGGAVGQTIRVQGDPYTVKGVFIEMGFDASGTDDWDDRIVVPFTTSSRRLFGRAYMEQIVLRVADAGRVAEAAERIREVLRAQHSIQPGAPDDFFVREPEIVEDTALETSNTLTALLIGLSLVALLAGGFVVMNVMLLSVSQRTHEIGLRRAVGATASDISRQFLTEASVVAVLAAVVGAVGGILIATLLSALGIAPARITVLPFIAAVAACSAIAIGFGTQPARRAARIDPAVTLRERRV